MAEIIITTGQGKVRTHQLGTNPIVLGRDPSCDIPLEELSASRRHVRISHEGGRYILQDLGSKNGTLVNDQLTSNATLYSGDIILIGAVQAVFHDDGRQNRSTGVTVDENAPAYEATSYPGQYSELELSQRRLEILYELSDRLTRLRDRDELLSDAMDVCFEMLRFERGAIAIKQPKGNLVDWPVVRHLRGSEGELTVSRTILSSALTRGERVIVNDTESASIDPTVSMVRNNIRSAMCVPLLSDDQNLGVIYGDRTTSGTVYSKEDVDFFAAIAKMVTTGLLNARLVDEQKLKQQLENEIAMARLIQTGLFPKNLPQRDDVCIAALNHPGAHVSGDYYDVVELDDSRLMFLIADVTGEGVSASLLMANLQAAVRLTIASGRSLGELLTEWNTLIHSNTTASRFITCLIAIYDPENRKLELGVAGHHPPHLVTQSGCSTMPIEHDYPLGIMEDVIYKTQFLEIPTGPCTIVSYTDGVIEALNENSEQYGTAGVERFLNTNSNLNPQQLVDRLRQDVRKHAGKMPQGDDITILAVHLA